ncbi:MAG: sugar transferase [Ferruginibacter sp.]
MQESFLYIGSALFFSGSLQRTFPRSCQVNSLEEAKQKLLEMDTMPDMLIIDIPNNHIELVSFKVWLLERRFNSIPLIYNQSYLAPEETKLLFKQKLVDDVMDLHQHYSKLPLKLKFFTKMNSESAPNDREALPMVPGNCRFCFVKRGFDILVSLTGIILCLPIFLLIALVIKIDSRGPVFYLAKRAGRGFKIFSFYKFRTMVVNADQKIQELASLNQYDIQEKSPVFFKLNNDPRITKVGKFLRNSSLDELPQLFNVLKGDMSIVGNRPLPLYEASTLTTAEWAERFMAPAGITGLWQISKRGQKEMSNEERIQLDIEYARTRTLLTDLKIILKTPAALLQSADV